jgi:hypothetical protein
VLDSSPPAGLCENPKSIVEKLSAYNYTQAAQFNKNKMVKFRYFLTLQEQLLKATGPIQQYQNDVAVFQVLAKKSITLIQIQFQNKHATSAKSFIG